MPSKHVLAKGGFKKRYGARKGDMVIERSSKEKLIIMHERMKAIGK